MNPFNFFKKQEPSWFPVGLVSSFPDVGSDDENLLYTRDCKPEARPGCRVFDVPKEDISQGTEIPVTIYETQTDEDEVNLTNQVLVFKHRGKMHAVDHECPHSSFPLSRGTPFDIEDFGIVLSAGLTCPKHGWSFDLFTGQSDRGTYNLPRWDVDLRDAKDAASITLEDASETPDREVWIRRKPPAQRIG